jgi:hypothetical protein
LIATSSDTHAFIMQLWLGRAARKLLRENRPVRIRESSRTEWIFVYLKNLDME